MDEKTAITRDEVRPRAERLAKLFINRWEAFHKQRDDGGYWLVKRNLTIEHLIDHLFGHITLAAYVLSPDSQARYVVIDADEPDTWAAVMQGAKALTACGVEGYVEASRRGGHLWYFLEKPVPGGLARGFGLGLVDRFGVTDKVEVFPKQDAVGEQAGLEYGSMIRLPLGKHRKTMARYQFSTLDGEDLGPKVDRQLSVLEQGRRVSEFALYEYRRADVPVAREIIRRNWNAPPSNGQLSNRIKSSVTVWDFVSEYVELNANGKGKCPFHDDVTSSFSIHKRENYWRCFAEGCPGHSGASVIDFWSLWRQYRLGQNGSFVATIADLADMFGLRQEE